MQPLHGTATATLSLEADRSPLVWRLWHFMRQEWRLSQERAVGRAIQDLDHNGVSEDYLHACGRR
jgi:hypothetical protein